MRINWMRALLGGLLAGLIVNICETITNGLFLGSYWANAMKALHVSPATGIVSIVVFWMWGFLMGLYAIWLYASVRPRYGAGPRTALIAGLAVWVPGCLLAMVTPAVLHMFRYRLIAMDVGLGLVELLLGTLAGAWIYKEAAAPAPKAAAAAA
jgi:hypothetical protein